MQYIYYRQNLNYRLIYKNHFISNCISKNCERVKESNHKSSDNNSDNSNTRSTHTNQSENAMTVNYFSMNINILALTLVLDIRQMDIHDRILYVVDTTHRIKFILLVNIFIH